MPAQAAKYLEQLTYALKNCHAYVEEKTVQRRQRMTDVFNSRRSPLVLKEGDHVYVTHPYSKKPTKLEPNELMAQIK